MTAVRVFILLFAVSVAAAPGINAFDSLHYPMTTPAIPVLLSDEAGYVLHQHRLDQAQRLRYYSLRVFPDVGTSERIVQSTDAVVLPTVSWLSVPFLLSRSGRYSPADVFVPAYRPIGVSGYQEFFITGLIGSTRSVTAGLFLGLETTALYESENSEGLILLTSIIEENRLANRIVTHLSVDNTSDRDQFARNALFFADIRLNEFVLHDYSYDNSGLFFFTGRYNRSVNSDAIGIRLGSTQLSTEMGVRSFSGTRHGTTCDDTLFSSIKLDHGGIGVAVTVDRYSIPGISVTAENLFSIDGMFSVDIRNAINHTDGNATFTLAYTTGIGRRDSFPPSLRRHVIRGSYYDEIVNEEGFSY